MHTNELPAFVYAKPILLPRISRRRDQSPSFSAKWFIATEWDLSVSCVMSLKIETTTMRRLYAMRGASESTISVLPSSFRSVFSMFVYASAYVCVFIGMTRWNTVTTVVEIELKRGADTRRFRERHTVSRVNMNSVYVEVPTYHSRVCFAYLCRSVRRLKWNEKHRHRHAQKSSSFLMLIKWLNFIFLSFSYNIPNCAQ